MQTQLGLIHFWQQGDFVTHATAILLLLLSVGSWALIAGRLARQLRINLACDRAPQAFSQARNLNAALAGIVAADRTGLFAAMARAGVRESELDHDFALRIDAREPAREVDPELDVANRSRQARPGCTWPQDGQVRLASVLA